MKSNFDKCNLEIFAVSKSPIRKFVKFRYCTEPYDAERGPILNKFPSETRLRIIRIIAFY